MIFVKFEKKQLFEVHLGGKSSQFIYFPLFTKQVTQYFIVIYLQIDSQYAHKSHFRALE